jgi:hypothetical protein
LPTSTTKKAGIISLEGILYKRLPIRAAFYIKSPFEFLFAFLHIKFHNFQNYFCRFHYRLQWKIFHLTMEIVPTGKYIRIWKLIGMKAHIWISFIYSVYLTLNQKCVVRFVRILAFTVSPVYTWGSKLFDIFNCSGTTTP